jgi:hypothetical protein
MGDTQEPPSVLAYESLSIPFSIGQNFVCGYVGAVCLWKTQSVDVYCTA